MMRLFANLVCNKTDSVITNEKSEVEPNYHPNRFSPDDMDWEISIDHDAVQQNQGDDCFHVNLKPGAHNETSAQENSEKTSHDSLLTEELTQTVQANETIEGAPACLANIISSKASKRRDSISPEGMSHDHDVDMATEGPGSDGFQENRTDGGSPINLKPKTQDTTMTLEGENQNNVEKRNHNSLFAKKRTLSDEEKSLPEEQSYEKLNRWDRSTMRRVKAKKSFVDLINDDQGDASLNTKDSNRLDQMQAAKENTGMSSAEKVVIVLDQDSVQEQHIDGKHQSGRNNTTEETNKTLPMRRAKIASNVTVINIDEGVPESDEKLPAKQNPSGLCTLSSTTKEIEELSLDDAPVVPGTRTDYPLDGKWEVIWKSDPKNVSTVEVRDHIFYMMDCPCEIIWSESSNGTSSASFQWPSVLSENPVYQQSKKEISTGATCIEWATSDPQYGDITWNRLDAKGCKMQPEEKERSSNDTEASQFPLDGNWLLTWKSYYLDPSLIIVHRHKFDLFDCRCEIKFKPEDDDRPSFQWPLEVFSLENPIFQKGKSSIPMDLKDSEKPNTIEWTITDKQYGEAVWTRLNEGDSIESYTHVIDRKRKAIDDDAIKMRREEEEKRMKSSIPGKAWDLVKGLIILSNELEEVDMIAHDDIIYLAERLLRAQKDFKERNCPWTVDIAYHHTESRNLETIKTDGLLSRVEREKRNIHSNFHGSAYGDGIYCSSDPVQHANRRYGDTTILLARMKGIESSTWRTSEGFNTSMHSDFCVLKCCNQCIPLFKFKSKLLGNPYIMGPPDVNAFRDKLAVFQQSVQGLLDPIINGTVKSTTNVAWHDRHNLRLFPNFSFSQSAQFPMPPVPKKLQYPRPAAASGAKISTLKDIQNCNSGTELIDFIRTNNSTPLKEAAKMRLMTISPQAYSKYYCSTQRGVILNGHQMAALGKLEALKHIARTRSRSELFRADHNGWRPIHEAARSGHADVLEYLLEEGAKVNERTNFQKGGTPLYWAKKKPKKNAKAIAVLEKYGGVVISPHSSPHSSAVVIPPCITNKKEAKKNKLLQRKQQEQHQNHRPQQAGNFAALPIPYATGQSGNPQDQSSNLAPAQQNQDLQSYFQDLRALFSADQPAHNVNQRTAASNLAIEQQYQFLGQQNLQHISAAYNSPWTYPTPFAPGQSGQTLTNTTNSGIPSTSAAVGATKADDKKFRKPNLTYMQLCSNCTLCGDALRTKGKIIQLNKCDHCFHRKCIQKSMQTSSCCPVCSVPIGNTG